MLQVFAAKGLKSAKGALSAPSVARGCSKKVVNNKVTSARRLIAASAAPLRTESRLASVSYTTQAPKAGGDDEHVWEDLNGINDFYDPRWDSDAPEEEGTVASRSKTVLCLPFCIFGPDLTLLESTALTFRFLTLNFLFSALLRSWHSRRFRWTLRRYER